MNRRVFAASLAGVSLLGLAGCEEQAKPSSTATLLNNEAVHTAMNRLLDAANALESDADGFDDENWRDVVPEVKSGIEDLQGAVSDLRTALGYNG